MAALVEAFSQDDLERALGSGPTIVGVNARNLETLQVDLDGALRLAAAVPSDRVLVLESGIQSREDARRLYSWNTGSVARKRLPSEQFFLGSNSNGKLIRTYGKRDSTVEDYREATQSDPVPLIAQGKLGAPKHGGR